MARCDQRQPVSSFVGSVAIGRRTGHDYFQSTWKSAIAGQAGVVATFDGLYDPADLTFRNLIGLDPSATQGVLTVAQDGSAIGNGARLISIVDRSWAESSPVGGVIGVKLTALGTGTAAYGIVLHPLAADVNTTTGVDRDDGAQTTTGWTAHLHVTGITGGGTWIVKLQDAATLPTYADVTGGAFTSVGGAGKQRLQSASGATLRRFVRYVATRTGGAGGDSISFALAYSRNL